MPTGDGVATTVRQVPCRGRPVATENQVSASLEPCWPPLKLTRSRTRTAGTCSDPTSTSAVPSTVEGPDMSTGPVERWSLRPVHESGSRAPGTSRAGTVTAAGAQGVGGGVGDGEGDEVPPVPAGPQRRDQGPVAEAVDPVLPVGVGVVQAELEAPAGPVDHRAGDARPLGLGLGRHGDLLGARPPVEVDALGRPRPPQGRRPPPGGTAARPRPRRGAGRRCGPTGRRTTRPRRRPPAPGHRGPTTGGGADGPAPGHRRPPPAPSSGSRSACPLGPGHLSGGWRARPTR